MTPRLVLGFTLRSVVLWGLVRMVLTMLVGLSPRWIRGDASPFSVNAGVAFAIALVVTALLLLDVRAMRERVFLENMGVSPVAIAGIAFADAALLEMVAALVTG